MVAFTHGHDYTRPDDQDVEGYPSQQRENGQQVYENGCGYNEDRGEHDRSVNIVSIL
jgi:hypothetical protein